MGYQRHYCCGVLNNIVPHVTGCCVIILSLYWQSEALQ